MGPEIIHYLPQKIDFLGTTVHMQTLYMSWLTMVIVILIVAAATSQRKLIPSGVQNVVEMFIDWLGDLMEKNMRRGTPHDDPVHHHLVPLHLRRQ